ncbi:hypothetical protein DPMN_166095 [Dreissena polymorpha]|uniref:Uncharacterized protein n=1 Tax=Dreissena polymorpha TaxID=45954 RepID=A0A9D4IXK9_DREPO|nr:hypothetical protein DPMN_166095 [Dreissena polymorpha]
MGPLGIGESITSSNAEVCVNKRLILVAAKSVLQLQISKDIMQGRIEQEIVTNSEAHKKTLAGTILTIPR